MIMDFVKLVNAVLEVFLTKYGRDNMYISYLYTNMFLSLPPQLSPC